MRTKHKFFSSSLRHFSIGQERVMRRTTMSTRFFGIWSALKQRLVSTSLLYSGVVYIPAWYTEYSVLFNLYSLQEYDYPRSHWPIEHRGTGLYKAIVQASQSTQYGKCTINLSCQSRNQASWIVEQQQKWLIRTVKERPAVEDR